MEYCIPWEDPSILKSIDPTNPSLWAAYKFIDSKPFDDTFPTDSFNTIQVNPAIPQNLPLLIYENPIICQCGAYLDTNCTINKVDRSWECHYCHSANSIPREHINNFLSHRELNYTQYEIKTFPKNNRSSCENLVFIIDTSFPAVQSGFTSEFISSIREVINNLPMYYQVSILTTNNTFAVHAFNSTVENPTTPSKKFFIPIAQGREKILAILQEIDDYVPASNIAGNCIPDTVKLAFELLSQVSGGMILIGFSSLPLYGNICRSANYSQKIEGSYVEDSVTKVIRNLATQYHYLCSVHIFFGAQPNDCDLLTLSLLSTGTKGKVYFYESMTNEYYKRRIRYDLEFTIQQPYYSNAEIKVILNDDNRFIGDPYFTRDKKLFAQIVRLSDFFDFSHIRISPECSNLSFQIIFTYTKSADIYNPLPFVDDLEDDEREDIRQNLPMCQVRPRYIRIISGSIQIPKGGQDIPIQSIDHFSSTIRHNIFLVKHSNLHKAQLLAQSAIEHDTAPFSSSYHLYHSFLSNIVMTKLAIHNINKAAVALRLLESYSPSQLILYCYSRLIVVDKKESSIKSAFSSLLGMGTRIFTNIWEFDPDDLSKMVNKDPLGCPPEIGQIPQSCLNKALPLTRKSLDEGNVFIIHTHDSVFVYVKKSISSKFLRDAFNVAKFSELTHVVPRINKPENDKIWAIYRESCLLSRSKLFFEVLKEGNLAESILNDVMVDDKLVSFADLPTWIAQFEFEKSLISLI